MYIGVACPMANEGDDAVRFVSAVLAQFDPTGRVTFFAVLDSSNKDNSLEQLRNFERSEPRLKVVWAPENRCVVDAYVRGYREALNAGCDWVLEIDAGFSHQPSEISLFLKQLDRGYDCVFGSRFMPGGRMEDLSVKRYLVSRGGTIVTNLLLGTKLTDMTSGFEMFSRGTLQAILANGIHSRAHFFQTEIKVFCRNLNIIEVPITYRSPSPGLGSAPIKEAFSQLWRLTKLRWSGTAKATVNTEI